MVLIANTTDNITVKANFSGGGSDTFVAPGAAGLPTYWIGFVAPAGQSITSINVTDNLASGFANLDDVAIIATSTIPEPGTLVGFGILGAFGLLCHRFRSR